MPDLDQLLKPISDEKPAGPDLRYEASDLVLDEIKGLRTEVSPEVDPDGRGREADWLGAARACESVLCTSSKDLEVAAWLTEAWARLEGPIGLERGLEVTRGLIDGFWNEVHPGWDEEDGVTLAIRARPLAWLGGSQSFLQSLKSAPLLEAPGGRVLCWADYEGAQRLDEPTLSEDRRNEMVISGMMNSDEWASALGGVGAEAIASARDGLVKSAAHLDALSDRCGELFDDDEAPEFHKLETLLREIAEQLQGSEAPASGAGTAGEVGAAMESASPSVSAGPATAASGPIQSRDQALQRLREVADYFRRTEPHSPLASLIARGVRWGSMPFEDVLRDLARDDDFLGKIWETLGIEPSSSDDDD